MIIKSLPWVRSERDQITDLHISGNEKLQEIRDLRAQLRATEDKLRHYKFAFINLKRKAHRG